MRTAPVLAIALVLSLSGCAGSFSDLGGDGQSRIPSVSVPGSHGLAAGGASGHGAPQVTRGPVAVSQNGNRWRATQEVMVANGFGGADRAALSLATFNGAIDVDGSNADSYHGTVHLTGSGATEQDARDALASLDVQTPDSLAGGALTFGIHVVATRSIPSTSGRGASIALQTPRGPHYNLGADTSNGALHVAGLTGDDLTGDTSNGGVDLADLAATSVEFDTSNGGIKAHGVAANTAKLTTSNGGLDVEATLDSATLDTSNGPIDANLRPTSTGHYTLDSSNGQITLKLPGDASHGYDASASTSNGRATISLPSGEAVGSQSATDAHQRTSGFSTKPIQTTVEADSSNADVHVTAS